MVQMAILNRLLFQEGDHKAKAFSATKKIKALDDLSISFKNHSTIIQYHFIRQIPQNNHHWSKKLQII